MNHSKVLLFACLAIFLVGSQGFEKYELTNPDGKVASYPTLQYRKETVDKDDVNKIDGIQIDSSDIAKLLSKMSLPSEVSNKDKNKITVEIGPTRHDILHACDTIEDVAISVTNAHLGHIKMQCM